MGLRRLCDVFSVSLDSRLSRAQSWDPSWADTIWSLGHTHSYLVATRIHSFTHLVPCVPHIRLNLSL